MTQDERNAFHQAGHAVSYFLYGWPITALTLTDITVEPPRGMDSGDVIHSRIVSLMAGPRAEQFGAKESKTQRNAAFDEDANLVLATTLLVTRKEDQCNAIAEYCKNEVDKILQTCWSSVAALASALLDAKELPADTVKEILRGTGLQPDVVDSSEPAFLRVRGKKGETITLIEGKDFEKV